MLKGIQVIWVTTIAIMLVVVMVIGGCKATSTDGELPSSEKEWAEENPIVLGLPTSLGYWFGQGVLNGATMAVEEINAAGGVNVGGEMRPLKLISIDSRDSVPGIPTQDALMAIEKLILEEEIVGIVAAPNRSEVLLAAMELNAKYKIPQISTLAKSPAVNAKVINEYDKYKYCFRSTLDAFAIADYNTMVYKLLGEKFGYNKIAFINQDVTWANGVAALCAKALEADGWEVVLSEAVPVGTTDFTIALNKAKINGAQVLGVFFDMPEVSNLVKQYVDMEYPGVVGGIIGPLSDPASWEAYDGKIDGILVQICEAGVFPVQAIPKSVKFFNDYTERWGHEPEGVAGMSPTYDAVYIFADAIERAGTTDPDALVAAIEKTDIQGAIGRIRFNEGHNVIYGTDPTQEALGLVIQWQAPGVRKVVIPIGIAEAEIVLPPWLR